MQPHSIDRRDMMKKTLGIVGAGLFVTGSEAASPLERRQPKGLRVSCSSLAFSDMTWDKALAEIKKLGFRYADLAMFEGWTHVSPSALTEPSKHGKKINEVCAKLEIEPIAIHANFNPSKEKGFPGLTTIDAGARKLILEHFDRVIECAVAAGIPLVNLQPGKFIDGRGRQQCLDNAIGLFREMQPRARREGITLSFENHRGSIGESPRDVRDILDKVDDLKLDFDFSHVVASSQKVGDYSGLLKEVAHVGVRNAKAGNFNFALEKGGKMGYSMKPFFDALRQASVDAYVSVEYYQPAMRSSIVPLKKQLEKELAKGK